MRLARTWRADLVQCTEVAIIAGSVGVAFAWAVPNVPDIGVATGALAALLVSVERAIRE